MVLQDLSEKLTAELKRLTSIKNIEETFSKSFCLEIVNAFHQADVSNEIVLKFNKHLIERINIKEIPPGIQAKKRIESVVVQELISMIDPRKKPYLPKKENRIFWWW